MSQKARDVMTEAPEFLKTDTPVTEAAKRMAGEDVGALPVCETDGKLDPNQIDDVIIGCAMPEGSQGLNFARVIALRDAFRVPADSRRIRALSLTR